MAIDLKKLEKLCALNIPAEKSAQIEQELSGIIGWIDQLQEVDTDGVEPMASTVGGAATPERTDTVSAQNNRENLLSNAPASEHGFFVVPQVIE
jgi:aspartyl-tRNA(Asn)/glutamyl-tRNA(Gln) amidotransferase subunit C